MLDRLFVTLLAVADTGSFTKAAEKLYISPTAVMKQMNELERQLNLKLLTRAPSGVALTEEGKILETGARLMAETAQKTLQSARALRDAREKTFCVGTSLLNPAKPFMDLWYRVNREFADYKLHLVPFEDDHRGILTEIEQLGVKFDFLIGVCDSVSWLSRCDFLRLGTYRKMVAVSRDHPLATKKSLEISDLYGQTLMMVAPGDSGVNDFLRSDLTARHPQIRIEDTPIFYDLSVFNRCAETQNVLLTIECWREVHPGLVTIPVNWDYEIPYGLLYSRDAPEDVRRFVRAIEKEAASSSM